MSSIPHIPCLRKGAPYESLDQIEIKGYSDGQTLASVSTVNGGIIRRDLRRIDQGKAALRKFTVDQLIDISAKAGEVFLNGSLPLGDKGHTQSPEDYIRTLSSTSGLPHVMVKRNMDKI